MWEVCQITDSVRERKNFEPAFSLTTENHPYWSKSELFKCTKILGIIQCNTVVCSNNSFGNQYFIDLVVLEKYWKPRLSGLLGAIFIGTNLSHCYSSVRNGLNFSLHSNTYAYYSNSMQSTFHLVSRGILEYAHLYIYIYTKM